MVKETILWRRLDLPGHDACRLSSSGTDWQLSGTAVFLDEGRPTLLAYEVTCDEWWHVREGSVSGWSGPIPITARFARSAAGSWTMNGIVASSVDDCLDLDFGFTPATNIIQIRRMALAVGERREVPVAWFDPSAARLVRLPQIYERRSKSTYRYEAPTVPYSGELEVNDAGFVRLYPGLWEQVG
ncbi:MAG TPA: putative glycolipid-binding domain-containing protein [Thermoanaerobaculia bacterium]|nr:putative glycolipid-binding domain-containing protein [Thermoanaerobaculia bacterium]